VSKPDLGRIATTNISAYAGAGVDIDATNRAVERMKALARSTARPEVLADVGPFSALFRVPGGYADPVLVSSADGVGTKVVIARLMGVYDTVGQDLVNHCVNDILTAGAEPLFFLDYLANNGLTEDQKVALVEGVSVACKAAGCALIGGETADMPDVYGPGEYDLAGFIVGMAERSRVIDGRSITAGDALLALPSTGLHTNGYSLVRRIWGLGAGGDPAEALRRLEQHEPDLGRSLGEALLAVHRCYLHDLRPVLDRVKGFAHITGGGLVDNVPRILPDGLAARFDRSTWEVPPLFRLIQRTGEVPEAEMFRVFNMGLGAVLAVAPDDVDGLLGELPEARIVGAVMQQGDGARVRT
jgi:phosphoribosylformylglycinamidine cyclo-ligase